MQKGSELASDQRYLRVSFSKAQTCGRKSLKMNSRGTDKTPRHDSWHATMFLCKLSMCLQTLASVNNKMSLLCLLLSISTILQSFAKLHIYRHGL